MREIKVSLLLILCLPYYLFCQKDKNQPMPHIELKEFSVTEVRYDYEGKDTVPSTSRVGFEFNELTKQDTLFLSSYIADCGEFGGHREYIKIYLNDSVFAQHWSKPACDNTIFGYPPEDKGKFAKVGERVVSKPILLDASKKQLVLDYLSKFSDLPKWVSVMSNAPTEFYVRFKDRGWYRKDFVGRWQGFTELRNRLYESE